jgi:putative ATPase
LRNAPTALMQELGYGKDYKYAHNYQDQIIDQQHLPAELLGKRYYAPSDSGYERQIQERLKVWQDKRNERKR